MISYIFTFSFGVFIGVIGLSVISVILADKDDWR